MVAGAVWPIEEHTRAKHELLRRYLAAWYPILASSGRHQRLVFIDGFAGPGIYESGEPGSPLIALQALTDHAHFDRWSATEFRFLFIEKEADRCHSLEEELESFWESRPGGRPANINITVVHGEFANVAREIVQSLRERGQDLAPTLAFIDPFGWSGVPMNLIADLLAFNHCEVLFNFMFDSVNRFVADERPEIAVHFQELFAAAEAEHKAAAALSGEMRKDYLSDLYARQLSNVAGFSYVRKFELVDVGRGRTAYYLMFGTRHRKGLQVMKEAMWALDPIMGVRFAGTAGDQAMLFEPEPDFGPLQSAILDRFSGRTVSIDEIESFVIEETDYKASHFKRQVLSPFEKSGWIACVSDRRRRYTYPPGTVIRFTDEIDR